MQTPRDSICKSNYPKYKDEMVVNANTYKADLLEIRILAMKLFSYINKTFSCGDKITKKLFRRALRIYVLKS